MRQPISQRQSKALGESETSDVFEAQDVRGAVGFYRLHGKRIFDFVAALAGLVVVSPILLFSMLLVRLTSRGPVLFRQVRLGQFGRPFRVFKFRTMRVGADRKGPSVVVPGDQRLTLIGNSLRRTKLDELPQLLNVLRGDMSLVGPRPRVPEEVNLGDPEEQTLLSVRPGLTSYASIYHRMEADYCARQHDPQAVHREVILPQKGYLDAEYVKNLSFMLDLKLILLTILLVFIPGKARPEAVRFFQLRISPYSRAAQMAMELGVFVAAVWLAYWLRFEGQMSEFYRFQMLAFLILVPAGRWATNLAFGIYNMIWRYVTLMDAALLALSLGAVSAILVFLRIFLPPEVPAAHVFQMPLGVIAMEYFLALGGSLGLRALRRALYVLDHRYQPLPETGRRRILILGAGLSGAGIALDMARYPHLQVVGFVDDDASKHGCLVGGHRVIGSSEKVLDLMRENGVTDLIVCARSVAPERLGEVREACEALGVSVHVIPTVDQLLGSGRRGPRSAEC
jgi:lipopolysaccharide/colanic/teichoic acid biosynthesis glycosyltransferase